MSSGFAAFPFAAAQAAKPKFSVELLRSPSNSRELPSHMTALPPLTSAEKCEAITAAVASAASEGLRQSLFINMRFCGLDETASRAISATSSAS